MDLNIYGKFSYFLINVNDDVREWSGESLQNIRRVLTLLKCDSISDGQCQIEQIASCDLNDQENNYSQPIEDIVNLNHDLRAKRNDKQDKYIFLTFNGIVGRKNNISSFLAENQMFGCFGILSPNWIDYTV